MNKAVKLLAILSVTSGVVFSLLQNDKTEEKLSIPAGNIIIPGELQYISKSQLVSKIIQIADGNISHLIYRQYEVRWLICPGLKK